MGFREFQTRFHTAKNVIAKKSHKVVGKRINKLFTRYIHYSKKNPLKGFFILLALLLVIIAAGNVIRKPNTQEVTHEQAALNVEVYAIGSAPRTNITARVEKTGVTTIVAQTPGIVQNVPFIEGSTISQGNTLVRLSTNYAGGNAASVQKSIAQTQYAHLSETYDSQVDILNKQKTIAEKTDENSDELRSISQKTLEETNSLIALNESSITIIDQLITSTENAASVPQTDAEKAAILALKQQKIGLLNGNNATKNALRQTEYSTDDSNPPAELSNISKDLTLQQIEIQKKALALQKDVAGLQLKLAQIQESLMYPSAPFNGTVERVHVRVGDSVNPGDPLVTIKGNETSVKLVAFVSENIARAVAQSMYQLEPSYITVENTTISLIPTFVSSEPVEGNQFAITYIVQGATLTTSSNEQNTYSEKGATFGLDEQNLNILESLTHKSTVSINVPIGSTQTNAIIPFIPLDAVYQTSEKAYVYVVDTGKASIHEVTLGSVFGSYVEIKKGIDQNTLVILDRTVFDGEEVIVKAQ